MSQPTDHRRAVANALRSIGAAADVSIIILDNYDQAVAKAREEGHNACADKVLAMANNLKRYGQA